MTIDFNKYVKDGNFLDMSETTTYKTLRERIEFLKKTPDTEEVNVDELVNFINENNITKLNLTACNFTKRYNISFAELIKNCNITDLNISDNILGLEIHALAASYNITPNSLGLSVNTIGIECVRLIAKALKNNTTLTSLDLSQNFISIKGAKLIAEALENSTTLTSLNLSYNIIDVEGAKAIAEALENNTILTSLNLSYNSIDVEGVEAIAKALEKNTTLTSLNIQCSNIDINLKTDIETKLQRNKQIKDISESFKAIISKITLGSDGTLLLSWDEEGSDQNSVFNKLKEYNGEYGAFPTTVLEQIIAQSIYQNAVHVYKDEIEQLSFAAKLDALTKVVEKLSESLIFDNKEAFISKIAGIINEVKEMFMLELDILNTKLELELPRLNDKLPEPTKFLYYRETEGLGSSCEEFCDSKNANELLTNLYQDYPDLKMPGTILKKTLETSLYYNIAQQLKKHADDQTFKHNPLIQKLLNNFAAEFDKLSKELEGSLVPEQNESSKDLEHFNIHLSDTSDTQNVPMILGDNTDYETAI